MTTTTSAPRAHLHKRLARAIWTALVWIAFMRSLWPHGWTASFCWDLALGAAETNDRDGAEHGWLFGRLHTTPAEAVQGELECWSE